MRQSRILTSCRREELSVFAFGPSPLSYARAAALGAPLGEWCARNRRASIPASDRATSAGRGPVGVPDHLPQVPVGALEVTGVPAPEGRLRGFHHRRARFHGECHDGVDLGR